MKAIKWTALILVFGLLACSGGGGGGGSDSGEPAVRELTVNETESRYISEEGEVDNYHVRAAETNRFLRVTCRENSQNSGVDLLVTVSEERANGERVRLFGQHKPQGSTTAADIDFLIYIDSPKDLYITVRDLMDDDSSDTIPYHLTVEYLSSADGNHDFANAQALTLDADIAGSGEIGEVGEVDCFTFTPSSDSVQAIHIRQYVPQDGTQVHLAASLYDKDGNRIQRVISPNWTILSYLTVDNAPYFLTVEDSDSMHADVSAGYDIVINPVTAAEVKQNDVAADAGAMAVIDGNFTAPGAIEYVSSSDPPDNAGDRDWYSFEVNPDGSADFAQVELTIENGVDYNSNAILRVAVFNSDMEKQSAHEFRCGGDAYMNQFKAPAGTYYLMVEAAPTVLLTQAASYQVSVGETDFVDTAEQNDDNTESTAITLTPGTDQEGRVSYNSDVDWYTLTVDSGLPRILSVELSSESSVVDYQLVVAPGSGAVPIRKRMDFNGSDGPTHLKTSLYVTETTHFYFRVGDVQNDEGSSVPYTIVAYVDDIPASGSVAPMPTGTTRYYSEADEQAGLGSNYADVEVEVLANIQPTFKANLDWLNFHANPLPTGVAIDTDAGTGVSTVTFPWIAGYIDYQGDYDLFRIDFGKLGAGTETEWYYDVEVRLVVPNPGSHVEYVWKLYRDSNRNGIVMDNPTADDGYKACAGDDTPTDPISPASGAASPLDITTPSGSETFWIGNEWGADSAFYLGISDFYYQRYPGEGDRSTLPVIPWPDEDWGYDTPYYIQMTLTYHPGASWP